MSVLNLHFILLGIDIHGNFDYSDVLSGLTGEVANETKFRVFVINWPVLRTLVMFSAKENSWYIS